MKKKHNFDNFCQFDGKNGHETVQKTRGEVYVGPERVWEAHEKTIKMKEFERPWLC